MAKNRFTSAQIKRLKNFSAQRIERAHNKISLTDNLAMLDLGPEQHGVLIAHHSVSVIVKSDDGRLINCTLRQNLGALVTGDKVIWQAIDEKSGVVVACEPRRSVILRPATQGTKPMVANVDLMVIVVALSPLPQATTIDRYLILAHIMKLDALIVVNKVDLLSTPDQQILLDRLQVYQELGYQVIQVSTKNNLGIAQLESSLIGITSIVVGQSGVGKSSLSNTLIPNAEAQTNTLSQHNKSGRQTTSASKLYQLPKGGNLIDSPGIHQLSLKNLTQDEILKSFKEFQPYLGKCQFRNCLHANEPNCALKNAVQGDKIAAFRLKNYHAILLDLVKF
jgi:ribosome biogenesis GTPase